LNIPISCKVFFLAPLQVGIALLHQSGTVSLPGETGARTLRHPVGETQTRQFQPSIVVELVLGCSVWKAFKSALKCENSSFRVIRSASFSLRQEIKVLCSVFCLAAQGLELVCLQAKPASKVIAPKQQQLIYATKLMEQSATCKSHTSLTEIPTPVGFNSQLPRMKAKVRNLGTIKNI